MFLLVVHLLLNLLCLQGFQQDRVDLSLLDARVVRDLLEDQEDLLFLEDQLDPPHREDPKRTKSGLKSVWIFSLVFECELRSPCNLPLDQVGRLFQVIQGNPLGPEH